MPGAVSMKEAKVIKGGRTWVPSDEERKKIRMYAGLGLTHDQIGALMGKSADSLERHARDDLDLGRAEAIAKVSGNLVSRALQGDKTCMIFYLKTQAGWHETDRHEITGKDGASLFPDMVSWEVAGQEKITDQTED